MSDRNHDEFAVDWGNAPEGAVYHTVDSYAVGEFWAKKPHAENFTWSGPTGDYDGLIKEYDVDESSLNWRDSLRQHPDTLTPAQRAGFEVGDEAIVIQRLGSFRPGEKIRLHQDDGSQAPLWKCIQSSSSLVEGLIRCVDLNCVRHPEPTDAIPSGLGKPAQPADEGLTGPALLRAMADARDAGEKPKIFKFFKGEWTTPCDWAALVLADANGYDIRRKPTQPMTWVEGPGGRFEYPAPLREAPVWGTKYYPAFAIGKCFIWRGDKAEKKWLAEGRIHLTAEACDQHERAVILASGGSVSDA